MTSSDLHPSSDSSQPGQAARLALAISLLVSTTSVLGTTDHTRFINPANLPAPTGYTQVVEAPAGRTLYLSGQIALDKQGHLVGANDFSAQAEQVFANLKTALEAAGASFDQVVKLTIYVTDMSQLKALRAARDKYINLKHPPASTLVEVRQLARDGLLLEIDAIAVAPLQERPPPSQND
ncbi:RidA family protein [Dyella silvatica]|uniref:RidA family protein n=1 Tax=Dyella silvatica TaxID=2992128 RepID=UPI00225143D9|nr:RidA family protein [Dyella silvatica]